MTTERAPDPAFAGRFVFKIDRETRGKFTTIGSFSEVSGLSVEVEVEEVVEGGENQFVHKLPGRMKWPNIVLKRGVTDSKYLFEWLEESSGVGFQGRDDTLNRSTGAIVLVDAALQTVCGWEFSGAFPVRWSGPTLSASSSELAQEELEIAHHGFTAT